MIFAVVWYNDREQILTPTVHFRTYDVNLYGVVPQKVFLNLSRYGHVVRRVANKYWENRCGQWLIGRDARFEYSGSVGAISFIRSFIIGPNSFEDALEIFVEI
jgi:hypothetical protein